VQKQLTEPNRWEVHSAEEVAVELGNVTLRILQQASTATQLLCLPLLTANQPTAALATVCTDLEQVNSLSLVAGPAEPQPAAFLLSCSRTSWLGLA
jgi:hypothetical protein